MADKTEAPKPNPLPPHEPGKVKDPIASGEPGGPHTPGAKQRRRAERIANKTAT